MIPEDVFYHNPGPTNIPSSIHEAMRRPIIDYHSKEFHHILDRCLDGLGRVIKTHQTVVAYPASGHGAWEAALVNLFAPGERILCLSTGFFGDGWATYATKLGYDAVILSGDRRKGIAYDQVENVLRDDKGHSIKGVLVTHCETSTGTMTDVHTVRQLLDRAGHSALLLVDVISSLGCADFRMDEWGVDVAAGASQKGLMLPVGLAFVGISEKASAASKSSKLRRAYWDWDRLLENGRQVRFPGTGPVHLFYGLDEAIRLIEDEGFDEVLKRHVRHAAAARAAMRVWAQAGAVELYVDEKVTSPALTTLMFRNEPIAEQVRQTAFEHFKVQLGGGLGDLRGQILRLAHMGRLHPSHLMGALSGIELALTAEGVPVGKGGLEAALEHLKT